MHVHPEQSAFQKKKLSNIQIFIVPLLNEIAKKLNITINVASVDLEKAFDKVRWYRLLCKLIAKGIGPVMLEAWKNIYLYTAHTFTFCSCSLETFVTKSGIRQRSASSVLLFILFMDGLFSYLRQYCGTEELIKDFHALVHADDTLIISTQRDKFIIKCLRMLEYFKDNSLKLYFSKSSYFILNPKETDRKTSLPLKDSMLEYKPIQDYLGMIVADGGVLKEDVTKVIREKRSHVLIK